MIVQKHYHFYAAHRNKSAGEKCARIHGHTYDVDCFFKFEKQQESGVTMLFSEIDAIVEPIIKANDHYLLLYEKDSLCRILSLASEPFKSLSFETSAENLAQWLFNEIAKQLPIVKIELAETKTSKIIYEG